MTATLAPASASAAAARATQLRVTQPRVLRSEWTKFRSLRSTLHTLLVAAVLLIGLGAVFSAVTASQPSGFGPGENATSTSLTGTFFAQLAIGVLGVLLISGEYSTGMIRASLTVVPRRLPMLWAKLAVFAAAVFLTMLIASFTAFVTGQALLEGHHQNASLTTPGTLRSIVGAALYLTVAGITGVALGALLRNTAAAISTFVGAFFVIPPLTMLLPASFADHFAQYLPSNAGAMLVGGDYGLSDPLAPWTGFGVMCGYAVVLIGLAAWQLRRVDA
ncbi:MAG TPA: ABC transporter permease subunit [Jatrophihabitans sp.]|jgi:ABC-type transport system involved in multi-copper enzyme maturation permease subunit|uniref:ABC transporter permease subunit n=1 Tax=Jatrophihabitans sp. TaxID=1932789 RepID=UPI002F000392